MESADDAVLPALAALTAEYLALDKQPDAFFRAVCRILADLSYEEFRSLQTLFQWLASENELTDPIKIENNNTRSNTVSPPPKKHPIRGLLMVQPATGVIRHDGVYIGEKKLGDVKGFSRLAHLFQINGYLVQRAEERDFATITIPKMDALRFQRLIGSPALEASGRSTTG